MKPHIDTGPNNGSGRYDYVVVGAGSAGCVLAARLTEDPDIGVLLLEAGGSDQVDEVKIPAAFSKQFRTHLDWNYTTEEQKHLQGRRIYWPRGKMLGGSSSMNAMIYIRGSRHDYDEWAALGNDGWGYEDVLPYFIKAEDNVRGASRFHGSGGPLRVEEQRSTHRWSHAFVDSAVAAGYAPNPDFNGQEQDGTGLYQVTQRRGRRWSAASAYLRPALGRPNLTVLTHALTTRVLIERTRATGVTYRHNNSIHSALADREVIVSGGAVNSAHLLLVSGIGPAPHLRDVGVEVVHALPGVGEGLQDHPVVPLIWRSAKGSMLDAESPRQLADYYFRRRGMLASNVGEAGLFARSDDKLDHVDLQWHFAPVKFWDQMATDVDFHGMTLANVLVRVASRGRITLRSPDPTWKPAIDAGYGSEDADVDALAAGVTMGRELARQGPLAKFITSEWFPGAEIRSRDDIVDAVRAKIETLYHPTSSCRMGADDLAVVDSELRVHGLENLRVVDASVMPTVVRGNTNAPTIMIAERAADLLRGLKSNGVQTYAVREAAI